MKLARFLAWIALAAGCLVAAIAETPVISGVELVGVTVSADSGSHVVEAAAPANTKALKVPER